MKDKIEKIIESLTGIKSDLNKSNYGPKGMGLYNSGDNQKRKASNTGESLSNIGQNKNVKRYTTSSSSMQNAREAKAQSEAKKNPAPVKGMSSFSTEEIKAMESKANSLNKAELIKALSDAGHRESALCLKNWNELDKKAEEFVKAMSDNKLHELMRQKMKERNITEADAGRALYGEKTVVPKREEKKYLN